MSTVTSTPPQPTPATPAAAAPPQRPDGRFATAAEWWDALGDVPLNRILFTPWPGTATEADLLQKVDAEKRLCELVDGTLVEKPMGFLESLVAGALIELLRQFVRPRHLGIVTAPDATMRLKGGIVRLPDVAFFSFDRLPNRALPKEPVPSLAPDLAVEILSEGNTASEMERKLGEYFGSGVSVVWFIDPAARAGRVYTEPTQYAQIDLNGFLSAPRVLPDFSLRLRDLFAAADMQV